MPQLTVNRKCYQVLKPEIEFHMMNEIYAALRICTHIQKRRHFYAKTTNANIYMKGLAQCWGLTRHCACANRNVRGITHVHKCRKDDIVEGGGTALTRSKLTQPCLSPRSFQLWRPSRKLRQYAGASLTELSFFWWYLVVCYLLTLMEQVLR